MDLDVVMLSRVQFALTVMFHYLFPPLTIGLGLVLVWLGANYLRTGDRIYHNAQKFWTKIFALNFAMGVVSGIVMEFQFGTNWAAYSRFVGDVFGSALAAEGVFAFFLESGFLAVLVFGWDKVGKKFHFFATCMVALGSIFSAIWIVVANSWQQTPAGHHIVPMLRDGVPLVVDGIPVMRAEIVNFWQVVFNPSSMIRLTHVLIGCFIVGSFLVLSIGSWYLLKGRHIEFAKRSITGGLVLATISSLAALITGHIHANVVYEHQPAKLAAFEGHYKTGRGDLTIFGIPNSAQQRVDYNLAIPGGLSFLLHGNFEQEVVGLDKFRLEDQPPVGLPFWMWRTMVGIGSFNIVLTLLASFFLWRGTLFEKRWILWIFVFAILGAMIANHAGWTAAEVGRQPWVVHPPIHWTPEGQLAVGEDGVYVYDETQGLRTAHGVSGNVSGSQVLGSILGFGAIYLLLGGLWLFLLNNKIQAGPDEAPEKEKTDPHGFLEAGRRRVEHDESLT